MSLNNTNTRIPRKMEENEFFRIVIRRIKSILVHNDNNFYRYAMLCEQEKMSNVCSKHCGRHCG